jgi:hypothetical protein
LLQRVEHPPAACLFKRQTLSTISGVDTRRS